MTFGLLFNSLLLASSALAAPAHTTKHKSHSSVKSASSTFSVASFLAEPLIPAPDFVGIPVIIGSSNTTLYLRFDTTTDEIWVNSDDNELCSIYQPIPIFKNATSDIDEWNEYLSDIRDEYLEDLNSLNPLEPIPTSNIESYVSKRKEIYSSYVGELATSVNSAISDYYKTVSFTGSNADYWKSHASKAVVDGESLATKVTKEGNAIVTKAETIGAEVTSWGGQVATKVTSWGGQAATKITSFGESVGTEIASKATSDFGEVTSDVVHGWDRFTSRAGNFFGFKREAEESTSTSTVFVSTIFAFSTAATFRFQPSATPLANYSSSEIEILQDDLNYELNYDCDIFGTFNYSDSTTFETDEELFSSNDSSAYGIIGTDNFETSFGVVVENVTFGVVDFSDSSIGVFGVGKSTGNSSYPELLVEQGIIEKALYSFNLGNSDDEESSYVLFGAINYDHVDGNITLFPLLNTTGLGITLSSFGLTLSNDTQATEVVLAEGKTQALLSTIQKDIYLPEDVLSALASTLNYSFPVEYDDVLGRYVITEDLNDDSESIDLFDIDLTFNFQGATFDIALGEFLVPLESNDTIYINSSTIFSPSSNESFYYLNFEQSNSTNSSSADLDAEKFILTILPSDSDDIVLGLDFLQALYVVVDFEDDVLGLAYSKSYYIDEDEEDTESKDSNIVTISGKIPFSEDAPDFDEFFGSNNITSLTV